MSKINEIIVLQIPDKVDPCTAYLLDNGDGTHDRYVSDENGNISKQAGGGSSLDQDNIPKVVNITLTDLGMTSENTEAEINQALANYINGLNLTIDEKELYFFQVDGFPDSSSDSANQLIEVTYDELVNLKNTSSLVKGQSYLLTDYMTTYEQPVTGLMKSSGVIEPLIITATDIDKLYNQCKSTLYPEDIVYYEITGDIGNYKGTEGFTKGKIYRRIDTQRNNDIGTDWRHVKYDRNGVDKLLFEDYTGCYNNVIKTYYLHNTVVGNNFHNNTIEDNFNSNTIGTYFISNTIGFNFIYNTIGDLFNSNTIGFNFNSNTIGTYFYSNTIGTYFISNTIGDNFNSNTIGNNFYNNTIGGDFYSNTIEDTFNFNTIEDNFNSNTIGDLFNSNTIGTYFISNTIGGGFSYNGDSITPFLSQNTEFRNSIKYVTSSIEIQNQNIDVVVFKSPNGTLKQRYYDDSNNLVINNL